MKKITINHKSQAWGFDLLVATSLFITGIVIFYLYSLNYPTESQDTLNTLFYEGNFITDNLISEGFPIDWTESTVTRIGLLNNNKINSTKIDRFYNMANPITNPTGYARTKSIFDTRYDYFVNFSDPLAVPYPEGGMGSWPTNNPENLIKVSRLTIFDNKPTTMNLYIWE